MESMGTAAELGAFALSDPLRKRLLIVLGSQFENRRSFINLGPVRWANVDSIYGPAIYVDFSNILDVAPMIEERLKGKKLSQLHPVSWKRSGTLSAKELLFVLAKLVFVLGAVPRSHLNWYVKEIFKYDDDKEVAYSLSLACALGLVSCTELPGYQSPFFWNEEMSVLEQSITDKEYKALTTMRTRVLDPLGQIDVYRNIDHQIRGVHAAGND